MGLKSARRRLRKPTLRTKSKRARRARDEGWELRCADYRSEIADIADGSVDLVITDPPYGITNLGYDHAIDLTAFWQHIGRITKPAAVVVVFACGSFVHTLTESNRKQFRYDLIWTKNRATRFLDAGWRPLQAHENLLIFSRQGKSVTYNPQMTAGKPYHTSGGKPAALYSDRTQRTAKVNTGTRHPTTVLPFGCVANGRGKRIHPSEKPLQLMRWLVETYSNRGDLVVDPFAGSGVVAQACRQTKRRFWGCELNPAYWAAAAARLRKSLS